MDAARRPAAAMNCDDARGRALDKKGDMIGEGHKGTTGLGHDKTSVMCSGRIWHARSAPSTGQMGGSGGMRPTRFAGGKDRGFVAEPDEVRCDLSCHVLHGNAEVRFPLDRSRGREAMPGAAMDIRVHGNRVPRNEIALWSRSKQTVQEEPPLPLAPIPFHRNAL